MAAKVKEGIRRSFAQIWIDKNLVKPFRREKLCW